MYNVALQLLEKYSTTQRRSTFDNLDTETPTDQCVKNMKRLPPEIVQRIFRYVAIPGRVTSYQRIHTCLAAATTKEVIRTRWLQTPPLSYDEIDALQSVQLMTYGHDQGFSNPAYGHWAWYELEIDTQFRDGNSLSEPISNLRTFSHSAPRTAVHLFSTGKDAGVESEGPDFLLSDEVQESQDHELNPHLFSRLRPGDSIAVNCVAQFPAWRCTGIHAELRLWSYWWPGGPDYSGIAEAEG